MSWSIEGTVLVACNCDYGCPCNVNGRPSTGKCEGGWTWHIEQGKYGDVKLDGLNFGLYSNWPAAIHEGNGVGTCLIDQRADESQRAGLGIRFVSVLPQLTPATGLGAKAVAAYAQRAGTDLATFTENLGPALTPEHAGKAIVDLIEAPASGEGPEAYLLMAAGLRPVP